jgi:2-oxoisovalerate dehydrogenase E1 component
VAESIKKTGKALILHEDSITGGVGAEIAAWIGEHCFEYLDAPVMRVGAPDTPVPFSPTLEKNYLSEQRFRETLIKLIKY